MLTEPLPTTLDVRKAAARGVSVSGAVKVVDLQRFRPLLAGDEGVVQVELDCYRDEENRYLVDVRLTVDVAVSCQRCLEPMSVHIASDNALAVVWSDEQAAHLPRHLDPLIVDGESCTLWDMVEDELILALPAFNYHPPEECKQIATEFSLQPEQDSEVDEKPNPFNVLAQLKPGNE